jgi:HAD superfamily hydrolase (TIGR01509 family)
MLRAVLLDVDGTLVRSNDAHAEAWSRAFRAYGYDVSPAKVRGWIGMGGDKILRQVDPELTSESGLGKAIEQLRPQIFLGEYVARLESTNGARALLERIHAAELLRVVATSAKEEELWPVLKAAGIQDEIDLATTSDDADRSKPDPDIVVAALCKASCAKSEAIYLGDTPYDITAAHAAGLSVIALTCGGWDRAALAQADAVYEDPADLLEHFGSWESAALVER